MGGVSSVGDREDAAAGAKIQAALLGSGAPSMNALMNWIARRLARRDLMTR